MAQNPPENSCCSKTIKKRKRNVKVVNHDQEAAAAANSTPNIETTSNHEVEQNIANGVIPFLQSFPPGYRFVPSAVELIQDYLLKKLYRQPLTNCLIHSVNIYNHHPNFLAENYQQYPDADEWYFFTPRDRKYPNGTRPKRSCLNQGYWKATGSDKKVKSGNQLLGYKKSLVFYQGKHSDKGGKTNWIMHEYRAALQPRAKTSKDDMKLDDWVLCEIYKNKPSTKRKNKEEQLNNEEVINNDQANDMYEEEQVINNDQANDMNEEEHVNNEPVMIDEASNIVLDPFIFNVTHHDASNIEPFPPSMDPYNSSHVVDVIPEPLPLSMDDPYNSYVADGIPLPLPLSMDPYKSYVADGIPEPLPLNTTLKKETLPRSTTLLPLPPSITLKTEPIDGAAVKADLLVLETPPLRTVPPNFRSFNSGLEEDLAVPNFNNGLEEPLEAYSMYEDSNLPDLGDISDFIEWFPPGNYQLDEKYQPPDEKYQPPDK